MEIYDVVVMLFQLAVVYAMAIVVRAIHGKNENYRKYFLKGLTIKLFGGIAFALVYTYYYDYGGDSMAYYDDAELITELIFRNPAEGFLMLWDPGLPRSSEALQVVRAFRLEHHGSEYPVVRTAAILNVLGLNSYYSTTVLFAGLSFVGVWHFFLVFARRYPEIKGQLAIAFFYIPSVFFWGSGVMKDSIVLGFLGVMMYGIDQFLKGGMKRYLWLMIVVWCGVVIFTTKAYVLMAMVPALMIWVVLGSKDRIKNRTIRALIVPFLFVLATGGVVGSLTLLGKYQERYTVEEFFETAQSMQGWHYKEGENTSDMHGRGSSYTLGEYDPSFMGAVKVLPAAINVTLFRPYFWEVKNIGMLASAIESFIMLLFTLFIFIGLGFFRVLRLLGKDPFLLMAFSFAIFFAFAVGFTSYNFGALSRYKIPCIPFFVSSMLILNYRVKQIKLEQKQFWKARSHGRYSRAGQAIDNKIVINDQRSR